MRLMRLITAVLAIGMTVSAVGCSMSTGATSADADFERAAELVGESDWGGDFVFSDGELIEIVHEDPDPGSLSRNIYPDPGSEDHDWQYWVNTGMPATSILPAEADALVRTVLADQHAGVFLSAPVIRVGLERNNPDDSSERAYSAEPLGVVPWSDASRSEIIEGSCREGGEHEWRFVGHRTYPVPAGGEAPFAVFYCTKCEGYYLINVS